MAIFGTGGSVLVAMIKPQRPFVPRSKRAATATSAFGQEGAAKNSAGQLRAALALHQSGQLEQAEAIYKEILQAYPRQFDALQLLATIALQRKDAAAAVALFDQILKVNPGHASSLNNMGVALGELDRHSEAVESFRRALKVKSDYAEAHSNLGNALKNLGQLHEAAASYRRASEIKPDYAEAHYNLGIILKKLGQSDGAVASYRRAIEMKPDYVDALCNLGTVLSDLGQPDGALTCFLRAVELRPTHAQSHCNLGTALKQLGRIDDAVDSYRQALAVNGNYAEAHYNLGIAARELGQLDQALACYQAALDIRPAYAEAHCNLGNVFRDLGQPENAIASLRRALDIRPDYAEAQSNLGVVLRDLGQLNGAVVCFRRALEIRPDYAEAHGNLGVALFEIGKIGGAVSSFHRALEIKPDSAELHNNLAMALKDTGQLDQAVECLVKAIEIKPDYAEAISNLGSLQKDLGQLDNAVASIQRALKIKPDFVDAWSNLLLTRNYLRPQPPAALLAEARQFGEIATQKAHPYTTWHNGRDPGRSLRVGIVSGDLRSHSVGYFAEAMLPALALNASSRLTLFAYPSFFRCDDVTERIKACCGGWHSAVGLSDEILARRVREDGIDILIDLAGHTANNRLGMFAWKPAPVQATWLGYLATTGLAAIDYIIADRWALPEGDEASFTEKVWRLPESYLCFKQPDLSGPVAKLPALTAGQITFGSFNNLSKMNNAVVALWSRVLSAIPESRLFLKSKQLAEPTVKANVINRFAANGIGADRLIMEAYAQDRAAHLAAYDRVDIALDPFPYPGVTTTVESLSMGVPVLTLAGDRFLSRQGVSLMMNSGLPEWVAVDDDDYVARAVLHTRDLEHLARLRSRMRQQVLLSPIFDAQRFAHHFEAALRGMWMDWCNDGVG